MGQRQNNNYLGGDSSQEAFISLPLTRAISSGIIRPVEQLASSAAFRYFSAGLAIFASAFLVAFATASLVAPVKNSDAAEQINLTLDNSGHYVNVSSSGEVNMNLIATATGATVLGVDTVTTTTNSETGYKLYISTDSTASSSTALIKSDDTSYTIPATAGTVTGPYYQLDVNSWGYAVPNLYDNSATITESSYFMPVPVSGSEHLINSKTAAVESGDVTNVYFGVKANSAMPAGIYVGTVLYTVLSEGSPATLNGISLSPARVTMSEVSNGKTLTIATGIYTSQTDIGTATITVGGVACTNVTRLNNDNSDAVNLTCTLPGQDYVGYYDVVVSLPKYSADSYSVEDGLLYYVPWDEMEYMQEMTAYACDQVETPSAFINGGTHPIYVYPDDYDEDDPTAAWSNVGDTKVTNINRNVPTTTLIDNRDGNEYTVRKFADGNCWMSENLRLVFAADGVNSVGVVNASGNVVAQSPVVTINENNSNIGKNAVGGSVNSAFDASSFANKIAYTETSSNSTYWSADATKYSAATSGSSNQTGASNSKLYARSYYGSNEIAVSETETQPAGTFYNWTAATAGSTLGAVDETVYDSICPSGWRLPEATVTLNSGFSDKSWAKLIVGTYGGGIYSSTNPYGFNVTVTQGAVAGKYNTAGVMNAFFDEPFNLGFFGWYNLNKKYTTTANANDRGLFIWDNRSTSASNSENAAFHFEVQGEQKTYVAFVSFFSFISKGIGMNVRCVSQ